MLQMLFQKACLVPPQNVKIAGAGSNLEYAVEAQSVERTTFNRKEAGSIPVDGASPMSSNGKDMWFSPTRSGFDSLHWLCAQGVGAPARFLGPFFQW